MAEDLDGKSSISASKRNIDRLKAFGKYGDTLDDLLDLVLTIAEKHRKSEK